MKMVCDINMCTGCMACAEICPKGAISISDNIKAINAVVDETKCINCGACEQVCQQINPPEFRAPNMWFQGWAMNETSRSKSSSGGFAFQIMSRFIEEGGIVCSCLFDNGDFNYNIANNKDELSSFRGSKYVKSNPKSIYSSIKKLIRAKHKVLFVGLPCHVAGLIKYIGNHNEEYLYTIDLICHGTPSKTILFDYLANKGISTDSIRDIVFRQKNKFRLEVRSSSDGNTIAIVPSGVRDRYTIGFLNGLFYTENCYKCKYAKLERVSDITLGDSWGSELEKTNEGKKGISLALCQTEKGEALLRRSDVKLIDVDLEKAVMANHQLREPSLVPIERELFFKLIDSGVSVNKAIAKCYPKTCRRQDVKSMLIRLHLISSSEGC